VLIIQIGENIPLRIMLLLMDEVFDLRLKNQWLRRQIVRVLKQLIKAILGDRMNKYVILFLCNKLRDMFFITKGILRNKNFMRLLDQV
jgi:hypothetical protein